MVFCQSSILVQSLHKTIIWFLKTRVIWTTFMDIPFKDQNDIVFFEEFLTEDNLFINVSIIRRCFRQWAGHEDSVWYHSGGDCAHPSLWFCYPFQVSAVLCLFTSCYCGFFDGWITVGRIMNHMFCTPLTGRMSLWLCIQQMWFSLRGSSCSTHKRFEICSKWSCLWTQTRTHVSHEEVDDLTDISFAVWFK